MTVNFPLRFSDWTKARVWALRYRLVLDELGSRGELDWSPLRDRLGEHAGPEEWDLTGPNPVDRGKYGSKIHLITERTDLPISLAISAANLHDSQALIRLVKGIPPICSRRGRRRRKPGKLHGEQGYDYSHLRRWRASAVSPARISRKGVESSQRLGRHRWTIERNMAWLAGCRRLHRRYERKADRFLAFTSIACTLICYRRLTKWDDPPRTSGPTCPRCRRPAPEAAEAAMPCPVGVAGNCVYLSGGFAGANFIGTVEALDPPRPS
ncbi:IS5 family transposase [Streptomyces gardneri]|uniref:IS5 family transposase n=1 Tax=Streptomyces gardneri TaxID=66892 RepID=UPI003678FBCC